MEEGIFVSQEVFAKELLKKFNMLNCKPVNIPMECGAKLSKMKADEEKVNSTMFKSLDGGLKYLTCKRSDILFFVVIVSFFMEVPTKSHLMASKRILRYIRGTLDYEIFFSSSNDFKLMGYCGSDFA